MSQIVACAFACALLVTQRHSSVQIDRADDLKPAMTAIGEAFAIIETATESTLFLLNSVRGDALTRHDVILENLTAVRDFFDRQKKADATTLATDALAALMAVRAELAAAEPDGASAAEAVGELRSKCAACHASQREGDARTGYRLKP